MAGIADITKKCWILALFIRDDNERLLLGDGAFEFTKKQQQFKANTFVNDTVEVQGNDGVLLSGQVRRAATQAFDGYIGDALVPKQTIEVYRRQFINFFRKNHFYTVVYIFPDGSAIKRQRGFIVDAPAVPELYQVHPTYHVALNFEDVNYYSYTEDANGNETYGQSATLYLFNSPTGGLMFDGDGAVFDEDGQYWLDGVGGTATVTIGSIDTVYPIWTVTGLAINPRLENLTTGAVIQFNGTVPAGSTLKVDMLRQTATLNGTNVLAKMDGGWMSFNTGRNRINYIADNNNAPNSTIEWAEVVA